MLPERLNFLSEFTNFYNNLVLDLKEDKYNEAEFYLIITAKAKAMDRERLGLYRKKITERIHREEKESTIKKAMRTLRKKEMI